MSNQHAEPVIVARYKTEFEASLTKNMLAEAGIPSELVGAMTAGFRAETPGLVKVMVPGELAERALELLIEQAGGQDAGDQDSSAEDGLDEGGSDEDGA